MKSCLGKDATHRPADMAKVSRELQLVSAEMRAPGQTAVPTRPYIPTVIAVKDPVNAGEPPAMLVAAATTTKRDRKPAKRAPNQQTWHWVVVALVVGFVTFGGGGGFYGVYRWLNQFGGAFGAPGEHRGRPAV